MRYDTLNEKTFSVRNKVGISRLETSKNELTRINWKIVRRLVTFLYYNGRMKKTNIAMGCHMGYDKCVRYIKWMKSFDLMKREFDESSAELISLSEKGKALYKERFHDIENF